MSTKTMLVDSTQPEETRVAVVSKDNLLQDFDFESSLIRQIKGNIYLAKVTRVEPSLQAAFLEYGGNRQGFLPFSEIHPDYFRIPIADRQKLLEQELETESDEMQDVDESAEASEDVADEDEEEENQEDKDQEERDSEDEDTEDSLDDDAPIKKNDIIAAKSDEPEDWVDQEIEEAKPKFRVSHRQYKIQEVIKPRQIMLVQISKEERGNKGAAISTYISLPGRYCVLMPNSSHGGGVSRKIGNPAQRKKMKEILEGLGVPEGMSVILRTAGIERSKAEIKRDLDYLLRLWNNIREKTLESTAPALVYEEENLIKRSIRDLYDKDIDSVVVTGKDGYKEAKDFMKMLMPSHAKKVKEYKDSKIPLFQKYGVEKQIDDIFSTSAHMQSGGYIVINPTEALVSIDVNSGRSTKERHIEETALQTNLEAAEEVARQLRLRDLGGLVVIDFIDMESYRHNRQVEKRLKECLTKDRARVQVGRISNFGLLELSRQRLRPSLFETNFHECPSCAGVGRVRTVESAALMVLRSIERYAIENAKNKNKGDIFVRVHADVALYILNQKRPLLTHLEDQHSVRVFVNADAEQTTGSYAIVKSDGTEIEAMDTHKHSQSHNQENQPAQHQKHRHHNKNNNNRSEDEDEQNKKRRKRGRRGGRRRNQKGEQSNLNSYDQENGAVDSVETQSAHVDSEQSSSSQEENQKNESQKEAKRSSQHRGRRFKGRRQDFSKDKEVTVVAIEDHAVESDTKAHDFDSGDEGSVSSYDKEKKEQNTRSLKRKGWWKRLKNKDAE